MSGNQMYGGWHSANQIGQWHQQASPPPANTMHYGGVPSVNNPMIGMPNSDTLQPAMQSLQPIHSMPPRQPHQSLQQQQMPRTSGLYQPIANSSPSQTQLPQQDSQFQQHPQQSQYTQYSNSVLASQYWDPSINQQSAPLGPIPPHTAPSGFQHHNMHQQSPAASPLPQQPPRGHPPTSHTPDRGNLAPSVPQTTFPNSKDLQVPDQQMVSSLSSRHGLHQQHRSNSIQMMQQNPASVNNLPASPTQGPTATQMRSMQQPQQQPCWQQTNQYYQHPNQTRPPFPGTVNPYMGPYGGTGGTDMPNNIAASAAPSTPTRHMIAQKPGIDNNDRTVRGPPSGWSPMSGYSQQQSSAQGASNNNYYGHSYDSSSYYSMPGQPNMDSSQTHNNAGSNIHQNQYWNAPIDHGQTPPALVNRPMSNSMHHNLVRQSPSASPLPHSVRNQPPSSQTPDRSPSIGNIPPPSVSASSYPSPSHQSANTTKNQSGSNSLAQLEQMVMPHLGAPGGVVKSPSHKSSTSSPIPNQANSNSGMNHQLTYSGNYNPNAADQNTGTYFNSASSGPSQQHGYFPQYGTGPAEIPKTPSMWQEQQPPPAPGSSMMDTSSQYGQPNHYDTQPNISYGEYASSLPVPSHEYSHMQQSETSAAPPPEAADPYAIDFQTFDDYDEQPATLKSKKGRPKKGDGTEAKKERKPRAPRAPKTPAAPKGKKGKASIVAADPSLDPTMQAAQFESTNVVSNEYNPPIMSQDPYPAPQDLYNSSNSHMNQPEPQSMYDQGNLTHLTPTTKPGDNQQPGAQQEYMPYSEYSQPNSKPSEPSEGHQVHRDDNSIEDLIKSSDKNGEPSFQDNIVNSQMPDNNNANTSDISQPMLNSPVGKTSTPKSVTPVMQEINKAVGEPETQPLEVLSNDSSISMSDNINTPASTHMEQADRICDDENLEQTQKDTKDAPGPSPNEPNQLHMNQYNPDQMQQQQVVDPNHPNNAMNSDEPAPCQNIVKQSEIPSSIPPPCMSDSATMPDESIQEPHTLPDDPIGDFNGDQTTMVPQSEPKKFKTKRLKKEKSSGDSSGKRKIKSRVAVPPPPPSDTSLPEATTGQDTIESNPADASIEEPKPDVEIDGAVQISAEPELKPKPKRKRQSRLSSDKPDAEQSPPPSPDESDPGLQKGISSKHIKRPKITEGSEIGLSGDDEDSGPKSKQTCKNETRSSSNTVEARSEPPVAIAPPTSQHPKPESVVSPALSSSSTSTVSLVKQDLSPSTSSTDKPVICLLTGSNSVGTSSISPATKATSNGSNSSGGSGHKSSRRRSSERRESVREGLMRTADFVIAIKDLKNENPPLWRITGNNLLQQFEPTRHDGVVLYENTNQYAGWNLDIKKDYVGVDVRLTQHSRSQIMVERLALNLQTSSEEIDYYDMHYGVYIQILCCVCLNANFWQELEDDKERHNLNYYMKSTVVIDDVIQRSKAKLISKVKLDQDTIKSLDRYPNITKEQPDKGDKDHLCMGCNNLPSVHVRSFTMESYDRDSLQMIDTTLDQAETKKIRLCSLCNERVELYSEMQHFKWKLYLKAKEKVQRHLGKNKEVSDILDECMRDEEWMSMMFEERDKVWDKVENVG